MDKPKRLEYSQSEIGNSCYQDALIDWQGERIKELEAELFLKIEDCEVLMKNNREACDGRHTYMDLCADRNKTIATLKEALELLASDNHFVEGDYGFQLVIIARTALDKCFGKKEKVRWEMDNA